MKLNGVDSHALTLSIGLSLSTFSPDLSAMSWQMPEGQKVSSSWWWADAMEELGVKLRTFST
jgi:hypothetical protein